MEIRVLFVDDDPAALRLLETTFQDEILVYTAQNHDQCFKILNSSPIHIIISDYQMPGINGVELLKLVKDHNAYIRRILLSSQLDFEVVVNSVNQAEIHKVLKKPWKKETLLKEINYQFKIYQHYKSREIELAQVKEKYHTLKQSINIESDKLLDLLLELNQVTQIRDFSSQFSNALSGLRSLAALNLELYYSNYDQVVYRNILGYISDIELISNQYDQKYLTIYTLLIKAYILILGDELHEAILAYKGVQSIYNWIDKDLMDDKLAESVDKFPMNYADIKIYDKKGDLSIFSNLDLEIVKRNLHGLISLDLNDLVMISNTLFSHIDQSKFKIKYLIILNEDLPIFEYQPTTENFDITLVSGFIVALSLFLEEMAKGKGDIERIKHDSGVVLMHSLDKKKYVLLSDIDEAYHRMGLRYFAYQARKIINSIPKGHMASNKESNQLIEIIRKIFAEK